MAPRGQRPSGGRPAHLPWLILLVFLVLLLPAPAGSQTATAQSAPSSPGPGSVPLLIPDPVLLAKVSACPGAYDVYDKVSFRYATGPFRMGSQNSALFGAWPKASIAAGFANKVFRIVNFDNSDRLGWLLTANTMPRFPGNPYVQLTRDYNPALAGFGADNPPPEGTSLQEVSYEKQLADKIAASDGGLQFNDVMLMALDVTQNDYPLATLTIHNLLKELTYTTRQGGDGQALVGWDLNDRGSDDEAQTAGAASPPHKGYILLDKDKVQALIGKLANLRSAGDPNEGDKMGPWYHFFGILFLGAVTSDNTSTLAAWTENATRYLHLGSDPDAFKEAVNTCAGLVATAIYNLPPPCGSELQANPLADGIVRGFDQGGTCSAPTMPHLSDLGCASGVQVPNPLNCSAVVSGPANTWTWQTDPNDNATPATGNSQSFTTTFPSSGTKYLTVFACDGTATVPNDTPGECDFFVGTVSIGGGCTDWNIAGTWTLYLGESLGGGTQRVQLSLTQNGQMVSGAVTSDPDASAGQSKAGTKITGTVVGRSVTLNLPWHPAAPFFVTDTLQAFTGQADTYGIDANDSFAGWSMSGSASCSSSPAAGGNGNNGSPNSSSTSSTGSGGNTGPSGGLLPGGGPSPAPSGPAPSPAPAASCSQWNVAGTWRVTQSGGYMPTLTLQQTGTSITGTFSLSPSDQAKGNYSATSTSLTGTLMGNQLKITTNPLAKRDGSSSQGQYTGTVVQGQITNGTAIDLLHTGSTATWTATGPTSCASSSGSAGGPPSPSPASGGQGAKLGPINWKGYCMSIGYAGASLDGGTINDWHCVDSTGKKVGIDPGAACQWQYGSNIAKWDTFSDPNSWACFATTHSRTPSGATTASQEPRTHRFHA